MEPAENKVRFPEPLWNEKTRSGAKVALEFGQKYVDAGKVQVTEVNVAVGNGLQPADQIRGLG